MRHVIPAFAAFACLFLVGACGFTPLYATGSASGSQINVEQIDGRTGQALRKALIQRLSAGLPGVEGPATLTIVLEEDLRRLAFQPDQAASRSDIVASAEYVLVLSDNAYAGTVTSETSFNVPDAPFADISAQVDASDRAANLLARRIVDDLRVKLAAKK